MFHKIQRTVIVYHPHKWSCYYNFQCLFATKKIIWYAKNVMCKYLATNCYIQVSTTIMFWLISNRNRATIKTRPPGRAGTLCIIDNTDIHKSSTYSTLDKWSYVHLTSSELASHKYGYTLSLTHRSVRKAQPKPIRFKTQYYFST